MNRKNHRPSPALLLKKIVRNTLSRWFAIEVVHGFQYVTVEWANYTFQNGLSRQHIVDPFGENVAFHRRYVNEYEVDDSRYHQQQLQAYEPVLTAVSPDGLFTGILAHHCPMQDRLEEDNLENKPFLDPLFPRNYTCSIELRIYDNTNHKMLSKYDFNLPGHDSRIIGFSLHNPEERNGLEQYFLTMLSWDRYPADREVCRCRDKAGCILEPWSAVCHRNQYNLTKNDVYVWSSGIGLCHRQRDECDLFLCVNDCSQIPIPSSSAWSCSPGSDDSECWEAPAIAGTLGGRASVGVVRLAATEKPRDLATEFQGFKQRWQSSIIFYPDNPYFNRAQIFKCSGGEKTYRGIFQVDVGATFENPDIPSTARVVRSCYLREYNDADPNIPQELLAGEGACAGCESWGVVTDTQCTGFTSWCVSSYGSSHAPGIYLNGKFNRVGTMFLSTWDLAGYTARQLGNYRYANLRVAQVFPVESPTNSFASLMFDIFYVIDFVTPSEHMRWGPVAMSELRVARCQQKQEEATVSFTLLNHDTLRRAWAPELLNVQAFRKNPDVVIVSEDAIEQNTSFVVYSQDKLGVASSFDTVLSPIAALATGNRSYGNRWVDANSGRTEVSGPAVTLRLGQMVPLDNEVTGGQTWATPRFTDERSNKLRHALAMTAQLAEACPNSRLPQPDSEMFNSTVLTGAVDRNILTAGPTFAGSASTSATFYLDELSDIWEFVAIFERKVSQQRDDLYFIFHHTETAEAARLKGGIGGDLPIPLPAPHQKGMYEAEQGVVYKWSEMDIRGVRAISIRYKTKGDFPATLKELQVKGKPQNCPPHGFFADSSCPIVEFRPNSVKELDCEGEWGEWSMCDQQCRKTRFFTIKRNPRPGGKPCLLLEKQPCDACEMWFTGGSSSTVAPSTTRWSTRSTTRTTRVITRSTSTTNEPMMIGSMPWYFVVAIGAANASLLLVILGTAWCVLQRRHRQLSITLQRQESRELAEAEEEAHNAEALAAAAKEAAGRTVEGPSLSLEPEAHTATINLTGSTPANLKQRGRKTKNKRGKKLATDVPLLRAPSSTEDLFETMP
ncbi:hypothetical protein NCLIV_051290 [Neospora caninum Liverpool]|uniref:Thrombospondin type 1 domain-containing protein n=1 Tax=Neospora caninum (strain Liverpool) TaxID=572307 RepID=F0VKV1_NEOCL|nr:hypothetical protein NCLIV_051290 [Neospora caninum Liverpool]CBZ54702.1 hypothetical protein NCLIV_051290 [Neospora caninum Liverpool]CEL69418.1 TPA: hypothetical protein BN1204_051290 [Neospora caninum Liverpool]|eukprot:XP_003884732.1 hypothetical protein NCLIV_051290 [Neospora caninum Liverpool]